MEYKDYYAVLGVPEDADSKAIKKAFRKLAREYHPDANPDNREQAEERFKEINEAYEVLGDSEKRAKYDEIRNSYQSWQRTGGQRGGFDWSQWASSGRVAGGGAPGGVRVEYSGSPEAFSDFFRVIFGDAGMGGSAVSGMGLEDLFNGAVRGRRTRGAAHVRGQDLATDVNISLEEAYHGTTAMISKDGRRLQVRIPRGARTGTKVRVSGEGAPSMTGDQAGDLYLNVTVAEDGRFTREGDNLYVDATIDLYTAVLGGQVTVPTLEGNVTLKVAAGTQPGQLIRLRGKGMPHLRQEDSHGDLYVRVHVELPTNLSEREQELFTELASLA